MKSSENNIKKKKLVIKYSRNKSSANKEETSSTRPLSSAILGSFGGAEWLDGAEGDGPTGIVTDDTTLRGGCW
jgi:hypothetical protein